MNAITAAVTAAKSTIDRLLSNGNTDPKGDLIRNDSWKTYSEDFSGNEISVNYRREGKTWIYTVTSDAADSIFFSKTGTARTLREARLEALDAVVAALEAVDAEPQPLEIDSDGNLLNGHLREKAAKMLGITDKVAYKVVSGDENNAECTAQVEKAENRAKKELLKLMQYDPSAQLRTLFLDGLVEERRSSCAATIKAVLDSGLLPDELRDQWKAGLLERLALREPEEDEEFPGGLLWLNQLASKGNAWEASNYATRGAVWCRYRSILDLAKHYAALNAEREHQYRDLLALINEM